LKKIDIDDRLLVKVCSLYYKEDFKQEDIARMVGLSRPTISRILQDARKNGVVKIEIVNPLNYDSYSIERELEKKYKLSEVIVVQDHSIYADQLDEIGRAAAGYLTRTIRDSDIVGVSMGTTIKEIARYADNVKHVSATFIPIIGGMGQLRMDIHSNQIVLDLANAFGGDYLLLHAPAVIEDEVLRNHLKQEKSIKEIFDLYEKISVALVGIGSPLNNSTMLDTGYFDDEDLLRFEAQKVAGDFCLRIYNSDGQFLECPSNAAVFGASLEQIRKIDKTVAIAAGSKKTIAIRGAIRANLIDVLITNHTCAQELIELPA